METNAAYNCIQRNAAATEDSIYELVDVNPEPVKSSSKWSPAEVEIKKREADIKKENKSNFFNILIATIAVNALLLVLIFKAFFLFTMLPTSNSLRLNRVQALRLCSYC